MKQEIDNICNWIKEYVEKAGAEGAVVGLSGGIDSAVVASLCVKALGMRNVWGAILPCESDPKDEEIAVRFAIKLGCHWFTAKLGNTFGEIVAVLPIDPTPNATGLVKPNIKARLRMVALYAFANDKNFLVIGTTNKTEMEIGYFTKYGDGGVDIEPISDYSKTEIREMARELGVPQEIIDRPPSAGLWAGQTDEDELGITYEQLDEQLFDNNCEMTQHVGDLVRKAQHKLSMPPGYKRT